MRAFASSSEARAAPSYPKAHGVWSIRSCAQLLAMTQPLDWAPYSSDGEEYRMLPPLGMTYCLTTDDIPGARPTPSTRQYLHGQIADKMFPEVWFPQKPSLKYKNLETQRIVDPLEPKYKLASGKCLIPAGDQVPFSNRVTDLMDTSDILGSKPGSIRKYTLRSCIPSCHTDDPGFHPTKRTLVRKRTTFGQGLDLFDIDIGRKKFGFKRSSISNPLDPIYPNELLEDPFTEKHNWVKKRVLPPRMDNRNAVHKFLDKMYGKAEIFPFACRMFDPNNTKQISHNDFGRSLEQFGVHLSEREVNEIIALVDKDHVGTLRYNQFAKVIRSLESLKRRVPSRLGGELGVPATTDANLGQGVQVLVESREKTKLPMSGGSQQHIAYNLFTGEPISGILPVVPGREPFYFSYTEQAAALSKHKHQSRFSDLLISQPRQLKLTPITDIPLIANESSVESMQEQSALTYNSAESNNDQQKEHTCTPSAGQPLPANSVQSSAAIQLETKNTNKCQEEMTAKNNGQLVLKKANTALGMLRQQMSKLGDDISPFPRIITAKKLLPHPFKQRIQEEQHSADRHAVQFLC